MAQRYEIKVQLYLAVLLPPAAKKAVFTLAFCLVPALFLAAAAQSLPINFLFKPNGWVGYEHIGPAKIQETTVTLPSPYIGLTVPLYTSVGINREPFEARVHQIMGNFYGRYQQVAFSGLQDSLHENGSLSRKSSSSYVAAGGFIGVKAGLGTGVWVYGVRGTMAIGQKNPSKPAFNILGAVARAHLKGLHKGYLYGLGFFASQDLVLPIPAFGYYYKPYKEITFYVMFPVQMRLSYQAHPKINVALQSTLSARPAIVEIQTETETRAARFNSLGFRHGLATTFTPKKQMSIMLEGGFMLPQQLSVSDRESVDYFAKPTWFVDIMLMHSLGDKLFVSPLGNF